MKFLIITDGGNAIGNKIVERFLMENWAVINLSTTFLPFFDVSNYKVNFTQPGWENKVLTSLNRRIRLAKQICLVHNAAYYIPDSRQIDTSEFRKTAETNIITPLILNHALIPSMPKKSSILYIGSLLSEKSKYPTGSSVISKHALLGVMRATCQDLTGKGIHTACICPCFKSDYFLSDHTEKKPSAQLDDIADLIWYCAHHSVVDGAIWHAMVDSKESTYA